MFLCSLFGSLSTTCLAFAVYLPGFHSEVHQPRRKDARGEGGGAKGLQIADIRNLEWANGIMEGAQGGCDTCSDYYYYYYYWFSNM